jgi:phage terminase small subunit
MRGRKPTPPGVRNPVPQCRGTLPDCPAWLDGDAATHWARLAPELHALGGLQTGIDADALAIYCDLFADYRRARAADDAKRLNQLATALRHAGENVLRRLKASDGGDATGEISEFDAL